MKFRLYYNLNDHGDGSMGATFFNSQAQVDAQRKYETDEFGQEVDEGGGYIDIEVSATNQAAEPLHVSIRPQPYGMDSDMGEDMYLVDPGEPAQLEEVTS